MSSNGIMDSPTETKLQAESLIPLFQLKRILNLDQSSRRLSLLGSINAKPALLILERAAFPTDSALMELLINSLTSTTNLGANDIYRWYMSNLNHSSSKSATPDLKLNLIYPCTPKHISKYTPQRVRLVHESAQLYTDHIRPWVESQRLAGRLDWIFNILDGISEQEDVILRSHSGTPDGFLLLPDLNWDRKTVEAMHLLALVERRDIWSLRDLRKHHVPWLKSMRDHIVQAATTVFPEQVEEDEIKCYVHYQPTYYHFHVHVVHVMLEAGTTQSVGKAFGLDGLISWLESMGDDNRGLHEVDLTYYVGEESELWKQCFGKIKEGQKVTLNEDGQRG